MERTVREQPWCIHYPEGVPKELSLSHETLTAMFSRSAQRFSRRPALYFFGKTLSYQECHSLVEQFACGLSALGIRKGDRVALCLPNSPQAVIASVEPTVRLPEPPPEEAAPVPAAPDPAKPGDPAAPAAPAATSAVLSAPVPQPGIRVRVTNSGTRYFLAGMSKWTINGTTVAGAPYSRSYRGEEMTRIIGVGVIGPDRTRSFFVPTDEPLAAESIRVEVSP